MPSMANLSLTNAAAAAVTATVLTPSAGDTVPARWRIENSNPPAFRPTLSLVAKKSGGDGNVRRVAVDIAIPNPQTVSGVLANVGTVRFKGDLIVDQEIPTSVVDDAVAYLSSFFASVLIKEALKSQIAPT